MGELMVTWEEMKTNSRRGFVHSIKVPRIYKVASVIARKVVEEGGSLKDLVYSSGHKNVKGVYALVVESIKHSRELNKLIKNSKLLQREIGLHPWLARILITELLFGKKGLKGESKPVQTILSYKEKFERLLENIKKELNNNGVTVTLIDTLEFSNTENNIKKMGNSDNVLLVLLMYSAAMLILPLFTFFAVKNLLDKEFHITGVPNTAWSVISAVIVVNLIIMAYVWRAFKQEVEEEKDQSLKSIQPQSCKEDLNLKKEK